MLDFLVNFVFSTLQSLETLVAEQYDGYESLANTYRNMSREEEPLGKKTVLEKGFKLHILSKEAKSYLTLIFGLSWLHSVAQCAML